MKRASSCPSVRPPSPCRRAARRRKSTTSLIWVSIGFTLGGGCHACLLLTQYPHGGVLMRHFLDRAPFDGSRSPWAGAGVARPVSEPLRGVFPDQDRVNKTVEDTITVGNDL